MNPAVTEVEGGGRAAGESKIHICTASQPITVMQVSFVYVERGRNDDLAVESVHEHERGSSKKRKKEKKVKL